MCVCVCVCVCVCDMRLNYWVMCQCRRLLLDKLLSEFFGKHLRLRILKVFILKRSIKDSGYLKLCEVILLSSQIHRLKMWRSICNRPKKKKKDRKKREVFLFSRSLIKSMVGSILFLLSIIFGNS